MSYLIERFVYLNQRKRRDARGALDNRIISTIERAFELARTGQYQNITQIREQLMAERYDLVDGHLSGAGTRARLNALCKQSRTT